jgi:hypothetical protein
VRNFVECVHFITMKSVNDSLAIPEFFAYHCRNGTNEGVVVFSNNRRREMRGHSPGLTLGSGGHQALRILAP